jgi:hypothetical protein
VGIGNHKLFLLFVFYIFFMCTYALLLVVARYAGCLHSGGGDDNDDVACGDGKLCGGSGRLVVVLSWGLRLGRRGRTHSFQAEVSWRT